MVMVLWTPDNYSLPKLCGFFTSMPSPMLIPRKTTFGESDMHPLTFLKSVSNIAHCSLSLVPYSCITPT